MHEDHSTFGVIKGGMPNEVKEEIKEMLSIDNQGLSSAFIAICLSSRQTCNLKDKDLGVRSILMKVDNDVVALLCNSVTLAKYLSTNPSVFYVAHYESISTLKLSEY